MKRIISTVLAGIVAFTSVCASIPAAAEITEGQNNDSGYDISMSGSNSLGNLLSDEYAMERSSREEQDRAFYIGRVTLDENFCASVSASLGAECRIIVGIYSEDGKTM